MTDSRTSKELADCPRCGGDPDLVFQHPAIGPSLVWVKCECGLRGIEHQYHHGDEKEAMAAARAWWNERRTDEPGVHRCDDEHAPVYYDGDECPVCDVLQQWMTEANAPRAPSPPECALSVLQSLSSYLGSGGLDCNDPEKLDAKIRAGIDAHIRVALERAAKAIEPAEVTTLYDKDYGTHRDVRQAGTRQLCADTIRGLSLTKSYDCIGCGEVDVPTPHTYCEDCHRKHERIANETSGTPE